MTEFHTTTPEQLLGPLNEVEQKHAPKVLFYAGDTGIFSHGARVSIVGSRDASSNGLARASKLASLLVERGIVVVSGLARGIDTAAHTTAIEKGGRTIAVLGTPLDRTYPKENTELQRRIMEDHLAISEFPVGYSTSPASFPIRNRTMALLSDATVIIEASDNSGSLHQGWEALRLGRRLYITNSSATDKRLNWPAKFISYGACVLADDSLEEFFDSLPPRAEVQDAAVPF